MLDLCAHWVMLIYIVVRDGECVCVELVARDRQKTREAVIFLGSIRYDVLRQVYDAKASTSWNWAQKLMKQGGRRQEFVGMRGPHKKGYAEMAVARVPNCGYETPLTENNIDFSELAGVEHTLNRRRMSETNLSGPKVFTRPSVMQGAQMPYNRRWQSETDTANQYPEVEGSNIDDDLDEGILTRLWSVRGFGQAWHWLREKKRAECTPLNAYLTYVTLSCTSILKGNVDCEVEKRHNSISFVFTAIEGVFHLNTVFIVYQCRYAVSLIDQ
uniref:XRN2-binding (XTBD) domain-containing protein n=1 Tax=Angiostrongylus cantonensis TaxID=6313 RepID=A0A0K0D4Z8_ANGCA